MTVYEKDQIWLQVNGYEAINAAEFSDRVTRQMEMENLYDADKTEEVRNQIAIDMLMEL